MTQEEKDLLLKDLPGRLPYGVKVKFKVNEVIAIEEKVIYNVDGEYSYITDGKSYLTLDIIKAFFNNYLDEIKPYLFPLSSMTKEQSKIYHELVGGMFGTGVLINLDCLIDFFNRNHLDWKGLIPLGLAEDATDKNIY
jgi:hypothetical protein